jgi:nitroreductase
MDIDGLLEIIKKRRHNGRVKADPVPDELLRKIIEAASWAPSGNNSQPWEFVVVKSPETKAKIREVTEPPPQAGGHGQGEAPVDPPVIIMVCGDTRIKESYPENVNRTEVFYSSLAACIQNLHLAATACGLATNWGTVREAGMGRLGKVVDLPEGIEIIATVRLGYPQQTPPPKRRRSFEEAVHLDKFDRAKLRDVKKFIESDGKGWGRL